MRKPVSSLFPTYLTFLGAQAFWPTGTLAQLWIPDSIGTVTPEDDSTETHFLLLAGNEHAEMKATQRSSSHMPL